LRRMRLGKKSVETRRKHEWVKPWSKKERLLVVGVFVGTIVLSGLFALSAREWKIPGLPPLKITSNQFILTNIFKSKPVVVQGEAVPTKLREAQKAITDDFKLMTKSLSGVYGIYVVDLTSGVSFGVYENEVFEAASLIKLPVMAMMYQMAEKGELDLEKKYTLKLEDKLGGSGSLYGKPVGYEITYRNLLKLMGQQSDNTAFNVGRKMLGDSSIDNFAGKLGMVKTKIGTNETTPSDVGIFFKELWDGNVLKPANKNELLTNLTDTWYENWLPAGTPDTVRVAHKFGKEVHVVNDAGIVFTRDPYVIVILSKGAVEIQADEAIPTISKMVYNHLTQ